MPNKRRQRRARPTGALAVVRRARTAAKKALESLREEIRGTQAKLEQLLREERSFRDEIVGAAHAAAPAAGGRTGGGKRRKRSASRRSGPPKAERYFQKLPGRFTLDDVRKLAGRASGVSIAQWTRSKRIRKVGSGYQKTAK